MLWNAPAGLALSGDWVYFVDCDTLPCTSQSMYRVPRTGGLHYDSFDTPVEDKLGPVVIRAAFVVRGRWLWPASGGAAINLLPAEQPTADDKTGVRSQMVAWVLARDVDPGDQR